MQVWCPTLVGRHAEVDALRARLEAARSGRGGTVFVSGEPGVGKSRLIRELTGVARSAGIPVLVGRAVPSSGQVAYRPVSEALAQALRHRRLPDDPELTVWSAAINILLPGTANASSSRLSTGPHTCAEALIRVLRWVRGSTPLVLVLEDLGWADPDTLDLVEYLADNLDQEPVLCVGTVRREHGAAPPGAAWSMVRRISQRGAAQHVSLAPLTEAAVAEMVRACMPDAGDDIVTRIQATAEGIPLMVEELLATRGVPATVDEAVRERVGALPSDCISVLFACAVLGRDFDWDLLPAITGMGTEAVATALEQLVQAMLISVDGDRFRFRHALIREAAAGMMLPPRRRAVARAALDAIDQIRPDHDLADLALQAGDLVRAAALLRESGQRSLHRGALGTAAGTLRRAVDVCPDPAARAEIQQALVTALALAGRLDEALAVGEELLRRLGTGASATSAVHLDLARAAVAATRWPTAATHLDAARGLLAARPDARLAAQASALAGELALAQGDVDETRRAASAALDAAESLNEPEIACHALELLGRSHRIGDLDAARDAFSRAYDTANRAELPVWRLRALHELGTVELLEHSGTLTLLAAREQAEWLGAHSVAAVVDVQLAAAYTPRFELEAARACARRAVARSHRLGLVRTHAMALFFDANVSLLSGDRAGATSLLAEAVRVSGNDAEMDALAWTLRGLTDLLWGDRDAATAAIDRGVTGLMAVRTGPPTPAWGLRAVLHAVRRSSDAPECIEEARRHGATAARLNRGYLTYAQAVLTRSADAVADGDADFRPTPVWQQFGRVLIAEAALADGWGAPQQWLREAREALRDQNLHHLARQCTQLLGDAPPWAPEAVTEREQDVLALVAEGLANREIAGRLHLSVRTVEKHVESLLRKAGARSRTQLAARVRDSA